MDNICTGHEILKDELCYSPLRAATLTSKDFWCSSSDVAGSFISLNILHGSSLQGPQLPRFFLLTEQLYNGQVLSGIISFAQNVEPCTFMHPVQLLLKNSHSSHFNPQADSNMVILFFAIYNIRSTLSRQWIKRIYLL
jgi:hypothetical protein